MLVARGVHAGNHGRRAGYRIEDLGARQNLRRRTPTRRTTDNQNGPVEKHGLRMAKAGRCE